MPIPTNGAVTNPYGPLITFQDQNILPPSAIYVAPTDSILLAVRSPTVACTFTVAYRLLRPDGRLVVTSDTFSTAATGASTTNFILPPSEGFLLSMVCSGTNTSRGQCFLRAYLGPAETITNVIGAHLFMQGYVSQDDSLAFPQSTLESSLSGRGYIYLVLIPQTFGANSVLTVPFGTHWLVRTVATTVTASAQVATRIPSVDIWDVTGNLYYRQSSQATLTASNGQYISWSAGSTAVTQPGQVTNGLCADLLLPAGYRIITALISIQSGDAIGPTAVSVEEWVGL